MSANGRYGERQILVVAEQHSWVLLTLSIKADVLTDVTEQLPEAFSHPRQRIEDFGRLSNYSCT